jgi:hypothetical protein
VLTEKYRGNWGAKQGGSYKQMKIAWKQRVILNKESNIVPRMEQICGKSPNKSASCISDKEMQIFFEKNVLA